MGTPDSYRGRGKDESHIIPSRAGFRVGKGMPAREDGNEFIFCRRGVANATIPQLIFLNHIAHIKDIVIGSDIKSSECIKLFSSVIRMGEGSLLLVIAEALISLFVQYISKLPIVSTWCILKEY
jgi:hypothetical protein